MHEQIECVLEHRLGHADAVVDDAQPRVVIARLELDFHLAAVGRVLGRVADQVDDHLGQARRVACHAHRLRRQAHFQHMAIGGDDRSHRFDRCGDHRVQVERHLVELDLAAGDAAHVEQVVDQARQVADLAVDQVLAPGELGRDRLAIHDLDRVADRRERVAQFMRQHRDEFVDALALGFEFLHAPPLGQVAGDLGETVARAVLVAQRGDRHVGPEPRAVAPDAPAGVFRKAERGGHLEFALGLARSDVFVDKEDRIVAADHLFGAVALDPLGARVPAHHAALRIEQEDRMVLHAFDEQAEVFLAFLELEFLRPPLGEIAGDRGEAAQRALAVEHRGDDDVGPDQRTVAAHPPAVVFEASDLRRDLEFALRCALLDRLGRVEHRHMLAEHLAGGVALDALRTDVPAGDETVRIEHDDRVVLDHLDKHAEALFALAQPFLVLAPLGEVAGDLGEAEQRAIRPAQRGDDHIGPEARAVLAHAPSFVFESAELLGAPQLLARPVARLRFGRVEAGEVAADDFIGAVALESLGAGVPGQDLPLRVEHEDRVVAHALDEQAKHVAAVGHAGLRTRGQFRSRDRSQRQWWHDRRQDVGRFHQRLATQLAHWCSAVILSIHTVPIRERGQTSRRARWR